jgi:PKD repeat protein
MKNDSIALVSNYNDLYEFNINTYALTLVGTYSNNLHGMAFGEFPLAVTINGPTVFCSTDAPVLSISLDGTTYQWTLEGADIASATDATYTPMSSGVYACIVDGVLTQNTITVEVIPSPEVSFTANPNPVFLGEDPAGTVNFTNTTPTGDLFMWDFDNGFNTSLENPSFSFTEAGTYGVTLWVTDSETGCTDSTTVTVIVNDGLGINVNANEFAIYPTVTSNLVSVEYSGNSDQISGSLMDMNGKIIEVKSIQTNGITTFDLSQLENGTYFISITNAKSNGTVFTVIKS